MGFNFVKLVDVFFKSDADRSGACVLVGVFTSMIEIGVKNVSN